MNLNILCTLLAQRIDPTKWQLRGTDICWLDPAWDTPENNSTVDDVKANYDVLAPPVMSQWEAEKVKQETARANLKNIQIDSINNIAGLRAAFKELLDAQGIEYKT
jgi:hypothetical protein